MTWEAKCKQNLFLCKRVQSRSDEVESVTEENQRIWRDIMSTLDFNKILFLHWSKVTFWQFEEIQTWLDLSIRSIYEHLVLLRVHGQSDAPLCDHERLNGAQIKAGLDGQQWDPILDGDGDVNDRSYEMLHVPVKCYMLLSNVTCYCEMYHVTMKCPVLSALASYSFNLPRTETAILTLANAIVQLSEFSLWTSPILWRRWR